MLPGLGPRGLLTMLNVQLTPRRWHSEHGSSPSHLRLERLQWSQAREIRARSPSFLAGIAAEAEAGPLNKIQPPRRSQEAAR
mmetsp:Transcript_4299/g.18172  ORF Transcript_4299/g.18172 Transcript_4299/m.18172 type:complete len:82 (-) Transcript_4299:84-329(-)